MNKHASGSHTSSSGAGHHALANHAMQTTNEDIIDPGGMGLFRLTMMVITSTICAGIFSLMGDLAAGGAHTAAVIIGWAICFVGVFLFDESIPRSLATSSRSNWWYLCVRSSWLWRLCWL